MKKIICLFAVFGLTALIGCQQNKPVDAAKSIMKQQIAGHRGFDFDTSKLSYKLIEQQGDTAKVAVSGAVQVKGELILKKTGGKWVMAEREAGAKKETAVKQEKAVVKEKAAEHK